MKIAELKKRLIAGEWNDIEFKEARTAVPKSAFETVSAFANTHGGWIVFGVSQHGEEFKPIGIEKPDKVQGDFLSVLHADAKINHDVQVTEKRYDIDGATVLAFHIAENLRTRKPVYLDGDIRRTFLRKGSGDYKAQMTDIERMLRHQFEKTMRSNDFRKLRGKLFIGATDQDRREGSHGRESAHPPDVHEDVLDRRGTLLRRELVGQRPAGAPRFDP